MIQVINDTEAAIGATFMDISSITWYQNWKESLNLGRLTEGRPYKAQSQE